MKYRSKDVFLASLSIQPANHRRGIGSAMFREFMRTADTTGSGPDSSPEARRP